MEILSYIAWGILTIITTTYLYFVVSKILIKIKLYFLCFRIRKKENPEFKKLSKEIKEYADSIKIFSSKEKQSDED